MAKCPSSFKTGLDSYAYSTNTRSNLSCQLTCISADYLLPESPAQYGWSAKTHLLSLMDPHQWQLLPAAHHLLTPHAPSKGPDPTTWPDAITPPFIASAGSNQSPHPPCEYLVHVSHPSSSAAHQVICCHRQHHIPCRTTFCHSKYPWQPDGASK